MMFLIVAPLGREGRGERGGVRGEGWEEREGTNLKSKQLRKRQK